MKKGKNIKLSFKKAIDLLETYIPSNTEMMKMQLDFIFSKYPNEANKGNFSIARAFYELNNPEALIQLKQLSIKKEYNEHEIALLIASTGRFTTISKVLVYFKDYKCGNHWCIERLLDDISEANEKLKICNAILTRVTKKNVEDWIEELKILSRLGYYEEVKKKINPLRHQTKLSPQIVSLLCNVYWQSSMLSENKKFFELYHHSTDLDTDTKWIINEALKRISTIEMYDLSNKQTEGRYEDEFFHCFFIKQQTFGYVPKSKNKLALIGHNLAAGGAEKILSLAFKELISTNAETELWAHSLDPSMGHDFFYKEYLRDIDTKSISIMKKTNEIIFPFSDINGYVGLESQAIYEKILTNKPSIIHAWQDTTNIEVALAGIQAGVKRIFLHPHNLRPIEVHKIPIVVSMKSAYQALNQRKEITFVFPSYAAKADYTDWMEVEKLNSAIVIPNGFEFPNHSQYNLYEKSLKFFRKEIGIPENAKIVIGIFRITEIKQPNLWLKVAEKCISSDPNIYFVLFGDGDLYHQLQDEINRSVHSKNIHLAGRRSNIQKLISASDVLLQTSRSECLPSSIIEALSLGIQVVATDVGGTKECMPPNGIKKFLKVCRLNDVNQITKSVLESINDKVTQKEKLKMINCSREYFSISMMAQRLSKEYNFNS